MWTLDFHLKFQFESTRCLPNIQQWLDAFGLFLRASNDRSPLSVPQPMWHPAGRWKWNHALETAEMKQLWKAEINKSSKAIQMKMNQFHPISRNYRRKCQDILTTSEANMTPLRLAQAREFPAFLESVVDEGLRFGIIFRPGNLIGGLSNLIKPCEKKKGQNFNAKKDGTSKMVKVPIRDCLCTWNTEIRKLETHPGHICVGSWYLQI